MLSLLTSVERSYELASSLFPQPRYYLLPQEEIYWRYDFHLLHPQRSDLDRLLPQPE